jgi:hypothetical protein
MEGINTRLWSALSMLVLFSAGTFFAFLPFYRGAKDMKAFCATLPLGLSNAEVRTQARASGYVVSYESLFTPPRAPDAGALDGGATDAGVGDAGPADLPDAGTPARQLAVGTAWVVDEQFRRLTCRLTFDDGGVLAAREYDDE